MKAVSFTLGLVLLASSVAAQAPPNSQPATSDPATSQPATSQPDGEPPAMPSLIQELPDYSGGWLSRGFLTGDWDGARTDLAENGVLFDFEVTQILQGNAHGGKNTHSAFGYSGSADYKLRFDTARMGLWPGGLITLKAETQFGQSINKDAGAINPPNFDALLPVPDDSGITTLSEFHFTQALSEHFVIMLGKVDGLAVGDTNAFAGSEKTQFLNTALRVNPTLAPFLPYTAMMAAVVIVPTDWLMIATAVADNDPEGAATRTGFNTAFHGRNWLTVTQEYDFAIKPFGLKGNQRIGWLWSSRDYFDFASDSRFNLPRARRQASPRRLLRKALSRSGPALNNDDWAFYYNFDQYVYCEPNDPDQGIGVFGRFGLSDGESNPFAEFYSIGVGGQGVIPNRDKDTFGVGYYFAHLSDGLPDQLDSEQGVELFYNIEVTPWLHITPDLQFIINPGAGFQNRDVSVVYGVRAQLSF